MGTIFASAAVMALPAEQKTPCNEDAMIVFDASGSMAGTVGLGIATPVTRIDEVRTALGAVLPAGGIDQLWSGALSAMQRASRP